jgi:Zn-dependent M28 family amino/carboxypeptidase
MEMSSDAIPSTGNGEAAEFSLMRSALLAHLNHIVRDRDPYLASQGHFYVREYVREQLAQWGTVETHGFAVRGNWHQNLILNLPGQANRPPILIGAHYDAVPGTPGADDNASGVAVLLELARIFAAKPARYSLRLVAFDMEEYGLFGSAAYAHELKQQNQSLRLMISLEMLGYCDRSPQSQHYPAFLQYLYPDRGDFIALVGNVQTTLDLLRLQRQIRSVGKVGCEWLPAGKRGMIVPVTRSSDHASFWDKGYPAMMITDTAFLRNPHYHKSSDRLETLDLDFMTGVCTGLAAGIRSL